MTDRERLLQISTKQVFETGGNTIKADDVNFLFSYITKLEYEVQELTEENDDLNDHVETLNEIIGMYEQADEDDSENRTLEDWLR